jgi:hypothetical protein
MSIPSRFIDVRPGEGRQVASILAALFGIIAGHTVLETARDALFLGTLPASRLTLVYLALAAVGLVVPSYTARFVRGLGRRNAVIFTLMAAAMGTTLFHFQPATPAMVYGVYLWSGLLGTVMVLQFWMFAGQLFTVAQGRRLFPGITAGGVLGAVTGGLLAAGALELRPGADGVDKVRLLLPVAAGLFLATALLLTGVHSEDGGARERRAERMGDVTLLREHPYVVWLALMVAASTAALLATDFLFKLVAKQSIAPAELGSFFARYYAVLNAAALGVQLFLAPVLLSRFGVVAALAVLPILLALGSTGVLVLGHTLALVLLTKGADGALRHSLHRAASELLLLPLPAEVRDRAKSLLDAVFARGAQALTAGGILLLSFFDLAAARVIALLVAALAGLWAAAVVGLRRRYLDVFRRELSSGALDSRLLALRDLDLDSVGAVMAALSSPDERRVVAAMGLLDDAGRARLVPALILYHESEEVLLRALDIVPRAGSSEWKHHAARLRSHPSPAVRAAALRALGRAREVALLEEALDDAHPTVRAHAAFQLAQSVEGSPLRHPAIVALLEGARGATRDERQALRLGLLEALRDDADERWIEVLLLLADGAGPEVVEDLALAMARVPDPRFVPLLVGWLGVREARAAVRDALVQHGDVAVDALADALSDASTPARTRRFIPFAVAAFATQRAAEILAARLTEEPDGGVRYRVLRGLTRIVAANPRVALDRASIEREMERNLVEHFRLAALALPFEGQADPEPARGSGMLLLGLIEDKMSQALERAFRLFKVMHPREDVENIFSALRSADRRVRGTAQEFLDALALECGERTRALLRLAADDLDPRERARRAQVHVGAPPQSVAEALLPLLDDGDESLAALAAYHALTLGDLRERLASLFDERPELSYVADLAEAEGAIHG